MRFRNLELQRISLLAQLELGCGQSVGVWRLVEWGPILRSCFL
jgi:hypothetical protein